MTNSAKPTFPRSAKYVRRNSVRALIIPKTATVVLLLASVLALTAAAGDGHSGDWYACGTE